MRKVLRTSFHCSEMRVFTLRVQSVYYQSSDKGRRTNKTKTRVKNSLPWLISGARSLHTSGLHRYLTIHCINFKTIKKSPQDMTWNLPLYTQSSK